MIFLLGVTLTLVGLQFFFLLREIKKNFEKVNLILEDVQKITNNVSTGSIQLSQALAAFKGFANSVSTRVETPLVSGLAIFGLMKSILERRKARKKKEVEE